LKAVKPPLQAQIPKAHQRLVTVAAAGAQALAQAPTTQAPTQAPTTEARQRLLMAGLQLFAQQGYKQTSTRDLAEAAQVNVAAISYYFKDKAGLYRAVFFEPLGSPQDNIARFSAPGLSLAAALRAYFAGFLEPLQQGDMARLCVKLHFREMLEPTGLWAEEISQGIQPEHRALVAVLCRHLGLAQADVELQRLAVCLTGLAVHVHVGRDVVDVLVPTLNTSPQAVDQWADALVMYGLAMVQAEKRRRVSKKS
jgi:TetR/AcrR family transcriptional regulator, regulator of cefoperazone and chloramphenicol sensitivity